MGSEGQIAGGRLQRFIPINARDALLYIEGYADRCKKLRPESAHLFEEIAAVARLGQVAS